MKNRFIAHSYLETTMEQTDEKILVVTLESAETGRKRFAVPMKSQIANRVKSFVDSGIKDYLEKGLIGDYDLIDLKNFTLHQQENRFGEMEIIYFHNSISTVQTSDKILRKETITKLETAFLNFKSEDDLYNSDILCHLKSHDGEANIYLAGKFVDEDKFIVILDNEFTEKLKIQIITLTQIRDLGVFSEYSNQAFNIKTFIETGKKIFKT